MRSIPRLALLLLAIASLGASSPPARAAATPERCAMQKLDAAARTLLGEMGCHARAVWFGTPVRPNCVGRVDGAFGAAFRRIEARGGCAPTGDAEAVDETIDDTIGGLVDALDSPLGHCAATKLRAAARRAARELACRRRAVRMRVAVDPKCLSEAAARFEAAFGTAERRFACAAEGNTGAVEVLIAQFVADVGDAIAGMPPSSRPTGLAASVVANQVQLTWVPQEPGFGLSHVRLVRRLNVPPSGPADPLATEVYFGILAAGAVDTLTGLLPDTPETARTYHYAVFACGDSGSCASIGSRTTLAPTVVQVLRAGGYVLHWRHSAATVCQDNLELGTAATTASPNWWKSCDASCGTATARQLDATGVMEATSIGESFDARGIPIGKVQSSEFCRNVTTAELMDFGPAIEQRQDVTFFVYDEAARCANSLALLAVAPAAGTNTAVIGHAGFTCPVLGALAWSEAAIYKPDGAGGSELVTRVLWDAWPTLP